MRGLADAVEEAAAMPTVDDGTLRRVGDVVGALADAALEMREAYWGYPHPGSVGDQPLVVIIEGRPHVVAGVAFAEHRIEVRVVPGAERDPGDPPAPSDPGGGP
jgi:hypothetical protein